jgi:PEP-CTERM motif
VVIGIPIDILKYGTLSAGSQFSNGISITADGYNWSIMYDSNGHEVVLDALSTTTSTTPEPGTLVLVGAGLLGLSALLKRKKTTETH